MSDPIHPPSIETLSAYFDNELPPSERAAVESYLQRHPEGRLLLDDFVLMGDAATGIEEPLPNDSYWQDLPDRVLARIAQEDDPVVLPTAEPAAGTSLWDRLWNPQGAWRFAVGTAAALGIGAVAWVALHEPRNPVEPAPRGGIVELAGIPDGLDAADEMEGLDPPDVAPEIFAQRVIHTLGQGTQGTWGESINPIAEPTPRSGDASLRRVGVTSGATDLALLPETRRDMQGMICDGPGNSPLQDAMLVAIKAEEVGRTDLAVQGYRVVMANAPQNDPLYWEANYRLTYHKWEEKIGGDPRGHARAVSELQTLAKETYQAWNTSGRMRDCQRAYCLNKTLVRLASEAAAPAEMQLTEVRVGELTQCVNGQAP